MLMKRVVIILILLVLSGFSGYRVLSFSKPVSSVMPTITPTPTIGIDSEKLWIEINNWREKNNLNPYEKSNELCKIANDRVLDGMDDHKGFYAKYSNYPYLVKTQQKYTPLCQVT